MLFFKKIFLKFFTIKSSNIYFQSNDPLGALSNNTLAARIYQNHCLLKAKQEFH